MNPSLRRTFWYPHIPFVLLLILATGVRFYQLSERPWDSDELGALFRAENAQNFEDHLNDGVAIDGHPALVQTFLWTNAQTWKLSPLDLKYLWAIIGLISIVIFYSFFWSRFGRRSAFFIAASLSLLWWPVSLGIWVRPYTIAFFWMSILSLSSEQRYRQKNNSNLWVVLMAISLALLAYTHYMSALTGVLFLLSEWTQRKTNLRVLTVVAILSSLLYVPHLGLFFTQLEEGGLSWLGKPQIDFLIEHIYYTFNESNLINLWLFIMVFVGLFFLRKRGFSKNLKMKAFSGIGIWLGIGIISFAYSHFQKPVLQHNALFFALPFLLGSISVLLHKIPRRVFRFFNFIWIVILFFSLGTEKGYFASAFQDRYASPLKAISEYQKENPGKCKVILDGPVDVLRFHLNKNPIKDVHLLQNSNVDFFQYLDSLLTLDSQPMNWIIALNAGSDINIQTYFWSHLKFTPLAEGNNLRNFVTGAEYFAGFPSDSTFLDAQKSLSKKISTENPVFIDFAELEKNLGIIEANDILVVSAKDGFQCSEVFRKYDLVSAIFQEGFNRALNQIDYRFTSNTNCINIQNEWLHHPIKLADILNWDKKSRLRIFYEYRGSDKGYTRDSVEVKIRKITGNPNLYGLETHQTIGK